jgi:hypothetical protein
MNFKEILYSYIYKPDYITTCLNNEHHNNLTKNKDYVVYKFRYSDGSANQILLLNDKNKLEWYSVFLYKVYGDKRHQYVGAIDTFSYLKPYIRKKLRFNFITYS